MRRKQFPDPRSKRKKYHVVKRPVATYSREETAVCERKRRYPDEPSAMVAAMEAIQLYRNVESLSVYKCKVCKGWHLTKRVDWKINRNRAVQIKQQNDVIIGAH